MNVAKKSNSDSAGILPGDWWFIRRQSIPSAALDSNSENAVQKLATLSDKASRLSARQIATQLAGVSSWLHLLQSETGELRIVGEDIEHLRNRLDVPPGKPWTKKLDPTNTEYWTADFLHKLAILRNVPQVAPHVLDWAMHLTWLTQNKGHISGGAIPVRFLMYCACALELCTPFKPLAELKQVKTIHDETYQLDLTLPAWKLNALRVLIEYRRRTNALLPQEELKWLDHLIRNESHVIFTTARSISESLRSQFDDWGITL